MNTVNSNFNMYKPLLPIICDRVEAVDNTTNIPQDPIPVPPPSIDPPLIEQPSTDPSLNLIPVDRITTTIRVDDYYTHSYITENTDQTTTDLSIELALMEVKTCFEAGDFESGMKLLTDLGITPKVSGPTNGFYTIEFEYNGKKYTYECSTEGNKSTGGSNGTEGSNGTGGNNPVNKPDEDVDPNDPTKIPDKEDDEVLYTCTMFTNFDFSEISNGYLNFNTAFGIEDGKIKFSNPITQDVYDNFIEKVKEELKKSKEWESIKDLIEQNGGDSVLDALIQSAWVATYSTFNSSSMNKIKDFCRKVLENLEKMVKKLEKNPEYLEYFTQTPTLGDKTFTEGLPNYEEDNQINYKGQIYFEDGTYHLDNDESDEVYQGTMSVLIQKLRDKYTNIPDNIDLNALFLQAQKEALSAIKGNKADCPEGTGYNGGSSRKGDYSKISVVQLVQLTLYYFDKLLYEALMKE